MSFLIAKLKVKSSSIKINLPFSTLFPCLRTKIYFTQFLWWRFFKIIAYFCGFANSLLEAIITDMYQVFKINAFPVGVNGVKLDFKVVSACLDTQKEDQI